MHFQFLPPPPWLKAKGSFTVCGNGAGVFIALETKRACDTTGIFSQRSNRNVGYLFSVTKTESQFVKAQSLIVSTPVP